MRTPNKNSFLLYYKWNNKQRVRRKCHNSDSLQVRGKTNKQTKNPNLAAISVKQEADTAVM